MKAPQLVGEVEDERLSMDPANIEASYAFIDAKRKLRMVLSTADLQHVPWAADAATHIVRDYPSLLCFIEDCASCRRVVGNVLVHNMFLSCVKRNLKLLLDMWCCLSENGGLISIVCLKIYYIYL